MTFPKYYQANTARRERYEQFLLCAKAYDESESYSSYKIKTAAQGIHSKTALYAFWLHYVLHNNANGAVENKIGLFTTIICIVFAALSFSMLHLIPNLFSFNVSNIVFSLFYFFIVCISILLWIILATTTDFFLKCAVNALERYKRELDD